MIKKERKKKVKKEKNRRGRKGRRLRKKEKKMRNFDIKRKRKGGNKQTARETRAKSNHQPHDSGQKNYNHFQTTLV